MFNNYNTKLMGIIGSILTLVAFIGVLSGVNSYVAKSSELVEVSNRLDRKILDDRIAAIEQRIWKLEDIWNNRFYKEFEEYPDSTKELLAYMNEESRENHRNMTEDIEKLEKELDKLNRKQS